MHLLPAFIDINQFLRACCNLATMNLIYIKISFGDHIITVVLNSSSKYTVYLDYSWCSLFLFLCPCMVSSVSVQHDGGFLPNIILLTPCEIILLTLIC